MSERHEFDVNGFKIKVTVGGAINDDLLTNQAVAELRDVVNFAAAWTQKYHRGLRIPKIPAVPHYEQPPPKPGEIWREIPGYEKTHEASNHARIRSKTRIVKMGNPWVWGGPTVEKMVQGRVLKSRLRGNIAYVTLSLPDGHQRACQVRKLVRAAFPEMADADG